jgi:hypothetical protein
MELNKRGLFPVKESRPTKTVVNTRSEGKPSVSSSSEFGVSSGSEEEEGREKESDDAADDECRYCAGLFCEDQDGEVWVR